jgi:hypothetical protein
MTSALVGEPHSVQRYVVFGLIPGLLAGFSAAVFHLSLPLATTVGGVLAALGAGNRGGQLPRDLFHGGFRCLESVPNHAHAADRPVKRALGERCSSSLSVRACEYPA